MSLIAKLAKNEAKKETVEAVGRSIRDPQGQLCEGSDFFYRFLDQDHVESVLECLHAPVVQKLMQKGALIPTEIKNSEQAVSSRFNVTSDHVKNLSEKCYLIHPKVFFPSYAHEWSAGMLKDAAELTLEINQNLTPEGMILKDSTPSNILFDGGKSIFVDVLSIHKRQVGDYLWNAGDQFSRAFILPLLAQKKFGDSMASIFSKDENGITPEYILNKIGILSCFSLPVLREIVIPHLFNRMVERKISTSKKVKQTVEKKRNEEFCQFVLMSMFKSVANKIKSYAPKKSRSSKNIWLDYTNSNFSFTKSEYSEKMAFIERVLQGSKVASVLDIGCNTGEFSEIASKFAERVVSIDSDEGVIDHLWEKQKVTNVKKNILPLNVNFSRPTPALGWENNETLSFLHRAENKFDISLFLAVMHHVMVTDGIPLAKILQQLAKITRKKVIFELILPQDRAFDLLARGREFYWFDKNYFEEVVTKYFIIEEAESQGNSNRCIYVLRLIDSN
jgi:SAM-dependent methyltransferase